MTAVNKVYTIKSTKWYGRFWPPERKKIKLMQVIMDYQEPEIQKKVSKAMSDHLIYGTPLPTFSDLELESKDE